MAKYLLLIGTLLLILVSTQCLRSVQRTRKGKLLFPYIVNIVAGPCRSAAKGYYGTCFSSHECRKRGGVAEGMCAKDYGVCCVGMVTCNEQVTLNDTYFQNPNYPSSTMGSSDCSIMVRRPPNVCQIRLDFDEFNLLDPDTNGECKDAMFTVMVPNNPGRAANILCGTFRNQHMYVDFEGSDYVKLSFSGKDPKTWRTRIQMIECNSLLKAPDGCLQYYYGSNGRVPILGYNPDKPPHLADLKYTLCVRREAGKNSITWEACGKTTKEFSMSGDATDPSKAEAATNGDCMSDYIATLGKSTTQDTAGMSAMASQFCGTAFSAKNKDTMSMAVKSETKPFEIMVFTDDKEETSSTKDMGNVGFCLTYMQT